MRSQTTVHGWVTDPGGIAVVLLTIRSYLDLSGNFLTGPLDAFGGATALVYVMHARVPAAIVYNLTDILCCHRPSLS